MSQSRNPKSLIKDVFSGIFAEISRRESEITDPLYLAELQLTRAELQPLIDQYGDRPFTPETIQPFRDFLTKRWRRVTAEVKDEKANNSVLGTDLIYPHAINQPAIFLCVELAKSIDIVLQKEIKKETIRKHTRGICEKIDEILGLASSHVLKQVLHGTVDDILKLESEKAQLEKCSQLVDQVIGHIPDEKEDKHQEENEKKKKFSKKDRCKANIKMLKNSIIAELESEDMQTNSQVNSLLMPTLAPNVNQLSLDKIILTDDCRDHISVPDVVKKSADQGIETFITPLTNTARFPGDSRQLTPLEHSRLLSHSREVRECYQAIHDSHAAKMVVDLETVLRKLLKDLPPHMNFQNMELRNILDYLTELKIPELDKLTYYCKKDRTNKKFPELLNYLNSDKKDKMQVVRANLESFVERNYLTLRTIKVNPPKIEDPLPSAKEKFNAAMENKDHPVVASPTYGKAGRQRLREQVYDEANFPVAVSGLKTAKQLADYLQAMPVEKRKIFLNQLSSQEEKSDDGVKKSKVSRIFNIIDEDREQLARLWRYLTDQQKKDVLYTCVDLKLIEFVLSHQDEETIEADYKSNLRLLMKIVKQEESNSPSHLLLAEIMKARESVPLSERHLLTCLLYRSALRIDPLFDRSHSLDDINNYGYADLAHKIGGRSWGKNAGGIALIIFGMVLVGGGAASSLMTGGLSAPVSAAVASAGAVAISAGLACITGGSCSLLSGKNHQVERRANAFFKSVDKVNGEKPREVREVESRGSINGLHTPLLLSQSMSRSEK